MKPFNTITIFISTLLLGFIACTETEEVAENLIPIEEALKKKETLSIKDAGEKMTFIPLETNEESLIGKNAYARLWKDRILVASHQQPVKMFDAKTGKFLMNIGKVGDGPEEYLLQQEIAVFLIDYQADLLWIESKNNKMLAFDKDGKFVRSVPFSTQIGSIESVTQCISDNKQYIAKNILLGGEGKQAILLQGSLKDTSMTTIAESLAQPFDNSLIENLVVMAYPKLPTSTASLIFSMKNDQTWIFVNKEPCLWQIDHQICFKPMYNDTVFQIVENKLKPHYIFEMGKNHIDYSKRFHVEEYQDKYILTSIFETEKAVLFVLTSNFYSFRQETCLWGVYNKEDKTVKIGEEACIQGKQGIFKGILQTMTPDKKVIGMVESLDFVEENPNHSLGKIEEDANPIVVIIE